MNSGNHNYQSLSASDERNEWAETPSLGLGNHDRTAEELDAGVHLATVEEKRRLWWRNAMINVVVMVIWFTFAILLTIYNKWMFADKFKYPLFVTGLHAWVQFALAAAVRYIWPHVFKPPHNPTPDDYGKKVMPTAASTALDIGLSNWSLKLITVSLYTMAKSATLIFVLLFAFLFKLEEFSIRLVLVVLLIFIGVIMSVAADVTVHVLGVVLILLATVFAGLRWSLTQLLLKSPRMGMNNPAATIFWVSPAMGVLLATLSVFVEGWGNVFSDPFLAGGKLFTSILLLLLPGFLAFAMIMSEYTFVQRTGVVALSITGMFKEVATLSVSAWLYHDKFNPVNLSGAVLTFIGVSLFTYHKYRKSIESTVPLDAHGNPIPQDEEEADGRPRLPRWTSVPNGQEESEPLRRMSHDDPRLSLDHPTHVLFSAGDSEFDLDARRSARLPPLPEDLDLDSNQSSSILTSAKSTGGFSMAKTLPPIPHIKGARAVGPDSEVVRQSLDIERQWKDSGP